MKKIDISFNILIIILELVCLYLYFNINMFIFYTVLSNIILLISSIYYIYCKINNNYNNKLYLIRYISIVQIILTFIVVLFILLPQSKNINLLIENEFIYMHLLCPIISIISFIFFEDIKVYKKYIKLAFIPTIIYGIILIISNIFELVSGPYPFLRVYDQPIITSIIWFSLIIIIIYFISYILYRVKNKGN